MTPIEVAARLGLKPSTLVEWRRRGIGPASVRLGHRTVRYRRAAVEAYIAANERGDG